MLCQHNKGHPDSFRWCQSSNNTNGHHDRFILLWRQKGGLERLGAVSCLQRRTSGQNRDYSGILKQVQGRFCPLTSVCLHASISTLLSASSLPSVLLFISTSLYWNDIESKSVYYYHHIGKYTYRHIQQHIQNIKVSKALFEHLTGLFLSSTGST